LQTEVVLRARLWRIQSMRASSSNALATPAPPAMTMVSGVSAIASREEFGTIWNPLEVRTGSPVGVARVRS
jgi:hypothetical protein